VSDAYSALLTPNSCVVKADFDGSNPQLDNAYTTITLTRGTSLIPFELALKEVSDRSIKYTVQKTDDCTQKVKLTAVPTTIDGGSLTFDLLVDGVATVRVVFQFAVVRESTMLDWIKEWEDNKTKIGSTYLITPKLFVGKKVTGSADMNLLTGVYLGPDDTNGAGIYGYRAGKDIFHINAADAVIGGWNIGEKGIYLGTLKTAGFTGKSGEITIGADGIRGFKWRLEKDGSGALAGGNIAWNAKGKVTFGSDVTLGWNNLADDAKSQMAGRLVKIVGPDAFTVAFADGVPCYAPSTIELRVEEDNFLSGSVARQWYRLCSDGSYVKFPGATGKTLTVLPDADYWENVGTLTIKCIVTANQQEYSAAITLQKPKIDGFRVEVVSLKGQTFKNHGCQTTLTANVYYQDQLLAPTYVKAHFALVWRRFVLPDTYKEVPGWWKEKTDEKGNVVQEAIDRTAQTIVLNYAITGRDLYTCTLHNEAGFTYQFPIAF
jgi:hypothetical protein